MIGGDVLRGYNDTMILFVLGEGDSYGYEISKRIREISGGRHAIKETTLYSAFTRLEKNGCIESFAGTETHGKPRTYYRITEEGRRCYREKCAEWELAKEIVEPFIRRD